MTKESVCKIHNLFVRAWNVQRRRVAEDRYPAWWCRELLSALSEAAEMFARNDRMKEEEDRAWKNKEIEEAGVLGELLVQTKIIANKPVPNGFPVEGRPWWD